MIYCACRYEGTENGWTTSCPFITTLWSSNQQAGLKMIASLMIAAAVAAAPGVVSNGYKCNESGSQQEMNACAELNFKAADMELNEVYMNLKASLTPPQEAVLVQDERKWLKSLDPECRKSANDEAEGGSMWPMVFWQCKADSTKLRVTALRRWKP
jgi:uncharacterized protein YecT (DUF1311 family)